MIGRTEIEALDSEIKLIEQNLACQYAIASTRDSSESRVRYSNADVIALMEDRLTLLYIKQRRALMASEAVMARSSVVLADRRFLVEDTRRQMADLQEALSDISSLFSSAYSERALRYEKLNEARFLLSAGFTDPLTKTDTTDIACFEGV